MYVFLVTWLHILNSWYCTLLVNVFLPLTVINLSELSDDEDIIRNKHFTFSIVDGNLKFNIVMFMCLFFFQRFSC